MLNRTCVALAALLVAAIAPAVSGGVATIVASGDTTIYQSATGALANGAGPGFFAGSNSGGNRRRGLLRFDLAGAIPEDATITGASVVLEYDRGSGESDVSLHRLLADWGEGASNAGDPGGNGAAAAPGDATWLHRFSPGQLWAAAGGDFAADASATQTLDAFGSYSWSSASLLADVVAWRGNPGTNFGWVVVGEEGISGSSKRFVSRENSSEVHRPRLVITYIPSPGAFVPGSLVLAAAGRRRRRVCRSGR